MSRRLSSVGVRDMALMAALRLPSRSSRLLRRGAMVVSELSCSNAGARSTARLILRPGRRASRVRSLGWSVSSRSCVSSSGWRSSTTRAACGPSSRASTACRRSIKALSKNTFLPLVSRSRRCICAVPGATPNERHMADASAATSTGAHSRQSASLVLRRTIPPAESPAIESLTSEHSP
eukprot:scaffold78700_cov32-Tisochrysis_lutea.AAC.4